MSNQEILDNAPEGATHVDEYGVFLNTENNSYWKETRLKWVDLTELILERNTRLLADIARIAEFEKLIDNQIFPSMGDGFSGNYISGYEKALADMCKALKEQGE